MLVGKALYLNILGTRVTRLTGMVFVIQFEWYLILLYF